MKMVTYLVHDAETGEIVHVHNEPAGMGSSQEEIIELAGLAGERRLAVFELPQGELPQRSVRVQAGELREVDEDLPQGAGGGAEASTEPASPRRYERLRPGKAGQTPQGS
jgi:hypothetical protein